MGVLSLSLLWLTGCQPSRSYAADVIHLTLWQGVNPPPNRDVLQKLVDQFNREHPQIQVESLYVGQSDQQMPKILAAVVGNASPDLLWYAPVLTGQLLELDAIRPLETWLNQSSVRSQIDPSLFSSMELEGHIWSIPFGTNNVGIFYRPSLFQAAGITQLPQDWQTFRQVAHRLTRDTNGDGRVDQHGMVLPLGKGEWTVFTWLPFMWSGGGNLVELASPSQNAAEIQNPKRQEAGGRRQEATLLIPPAKQELEALKGVQKSKIENPKSKIQSPPIQLLNPGAIAALQLWRDLMQDGSAILSAPERGYELDGFLAGKVAMQLSGPWTLGQLQATGVDFGVLPIPADKERATVIGGENLFVFKTTPERERAALVFAEYVLSERFQTAWAIGTGYLPVNLQSRQSKEYLAFKAKQPTVETFLKQAAYGRSRPILAGYNRISENLGRAIEAVLMGRDTPEVALKASQQRLDLILRP
ncbi:MAG: ABC transporter substrate-binding protein [Scytolyngbya sp. HA4215-MV1]|jgi:multiple sugar transport system substrate-binding protein|nr:ABC transporter substrate-binding protein [Scytolyngbya sp. HA4215-MV1]